MDKLLEDETTVEYENEVNLEELILLGDDKKIPIVIEFPTETGERIKAKALVKQLTLKELDNVRINTNDVLGTNLKILTKSLFKNDGERFSEEELKVLPLGVVNAIASKIMDLSGVDNDTTSRLRDF